MGHSGKIPTLSKQLLVFASEYKFSPVVLSQTLFPGILLTSHQEQKVEECSCHRQDSQLPQLFHARLQSGSCTDSTLHHSKNCRKFLTTQVLADSSMQVYIYAVQGKSLHLHLWRLDSLLNSNDNLIELDVKIENRRDNYKIPHFGIEHGLCGQMVIVRTRRT